MVERGEVALNDPASKYLPATVKMPERGGKQITLIDLAMHTSGLLPLPDNMPMKDQSNPYADYTTDKLYEFLSRYQLTRDPGSVYQYSNLGGGLLGHTLAQRAHTTYEKLVQTRITGPLGMNSTVITLTPELKSRFAAGHNAQLQTVSAWDIPDMMAGAGAIRSTANDMLTFLAANLGYSKTSLAPAMQVMVRDRRTAVAANLEVALGWHVFTANGHEIIWHNGGTGGFRTFVGYERKSGVGVVVLSNASTNAGVDDIGHHLLDTSTHLIDASAFKPIKEHKETAVDGKILDSYVGVYQLTPAFALTVTRDGNHLLVQATGQQQFSVFAESEHDFFAKVADVQFTFQTDAQGHATGIVLHQFGRDVPGKRVEAEPAK